MAVEANNDSIAGPSFFVMSPSKARARVGAQVARQQRSRTASGTLDMRCVGAPSADSAP